MKIKFTEQTKELVKQKMLELNSTDINDVFRYFIEQEQRYQKRIELLQGAIKHYEDALNEYQG